MRIVLLAALLVFTSCNGQPSASENPPPNNPGDPPGLEYTTLFSANRSWAHLTKQLSLGFRVPGTSGHRACRAYITQELLKTCDTVEEQVFSADLPVLGETEMYNIIGRTNLNAERRIILAAHWDTRPSADYNPPGQRDQPIPGANDGASGVAVLLELAQVFKTIPPEIGVDFVFFDGEDVGPDLAHMFYGSKYFAEQLSPEQVDQYNYGILLDMVGDRDLDIHPETNSEGRAGMVFATAREVSRELGYFCFKTSDTRPITDDHLPLIAKGIRMYDFIDFRYTSWPGEGISYWHTTEDTEDKCSKTSLEAIGRTIENMVYLYPKLYAPE